MARHAPVEETLLRGAFAEPRNNGGILLIFRWNPMFLKKRPGLLLKRRGKMQEARRELKDLVESAQLGPAHYRKAQAEWLERARRELG